MYVDQASFPLTEIHHPLDSASRMKGMSHHAWLYTLGFLLAYLLNISGAEVKESFFKTWFNFKDPIGPKLLTDGSLCKLVKYYAMLCTLCKAITRVVSAVVPVSGFLVTSI